MLKQRFELILCALLLLVTAGGSRSAAAAISTTPEAATAPTITTQPANATVKLSTTATFKVVASGTATLQYQWYKNGNLIGGAIASSYTTPATTDSDNGSSFTVKVTNSAGSKTSNPASLTVVDPPVIQQQPSSLTVTTPAVAEFDVYAYATQPMTCRWYKNGKVIAGATSCYSYVTEELTTADNGAAFTVVFTETVNGVAISTASKAAILTVKGATITGTSPIVGNWSGTATFTSSSSGATTVQVVAVFSQTTYSLTGTFVYTDENGIPSYGAGVAALNGQNVYTAIIGDDGGGGNLAAGFSSNLLTLSGIALGSDGEGGSGTLTISSDHQTLTGSGKDTDGDTIKWKLTREK
jgi:hypothetical protein